MRSRFQWQNFRLQQCRDCETLHYTNFDCNGTASDYHASAGKKFDGNHFLSDDDDKYERMDSILCKSDTVSGNVCNRNFNLRSSCSHRISESAKDSDGRSLEKCRVKGGRKSGKENRKCIVEKNLLESERLWFLD